MGHEVALVFLLTVGAKLPRACNAAIEGDQVSFGYDASSACIKPYSRIGRTRFQNLPCDFRQENWCTIAGNAYPWQAVRRFVYENQGLMKRMYGDEKHISVLKSELEKNDVELELESDHNHLYSKDTSSFFKQYHIEDDYKLSRTNSARTLNSGTSNKLDRSRSDETLITYRSRLTDAPSISSTTYSSSSSTINTWTSSPSTTSSTNGKISFSQRMKLSSIDYYSSTYQQQSTKIAQETNKLASSTTKTPINNLVQIAKIQNFSINEISGQIGRLDIDVDELTEIPKITRETTLESSTDHNLSDSSERMDDGKIFFDSYDLITQKNEKTDELDHQQQQQQFRPRPEYRPPDAVITETTDSIKSQLFQDVAAKDKQDPPVLKVRGINACPVKEEVVAPFWANNTRGEVLALLNLYPFEQYVHWEKCTDENKQMYCRDGCRCEQQYRLHRLLAYDPNNECRGIFSDWFKFPSCCICRCYDLPLEFRVTSRSPRFIHRKRVKVRPPGMLSRKRQNSPRRV